MTNGSETRYVYVFKFNTDLNKNTNNSRLNRKSIEVYAGTGPLLEAAVASGPAGAVAMLLLDWPCLV